MSHYFRDAIRLLFILTEGSQPLDNNGSGASHIFRGETRLHAFDFWVRYPDYLAAELLDRFESDGQAEDLHNALLIMNQQEPDLRRIPMIRYFFGAFDPIDNAVSILKSRQLVTITSRKSAERVIETNFLIFPRAFELCENAVNTAPVLNWYRDRAKIVRDLAGDAKGTALKQRQYQRSSYADTKLGFPIPSITDYVQRRLDAIMQKGELNDATTKA